MKEVAGTKKILIVDDDRQMRNALSEGIKRSGYTPFTAEDAERALFLFQRDEFSLIITDMRMPGMNGLEFIKKIRLISNSVPILVITGFGTVENAVECMRCGASDYLMKPFSVDGLREAVERLLKAGESKSEIITQDAGMKKLLKLALEIAASESTVLITGESGTGKELLARYIHRNSSRRSHKFVAVNCAAIPENLLEAELFGYEKGAFTGANEKKAGRFELADRGTLLLDEIGEMPTPLQAKLLRVLQEKEIDRIGGKSPIPVDIRVIATTNRDLAAEVERGNFREDLYYRLSVIPLRIPPLRERPGDIPLLAEHFLEKFALRYKKEIKGFSDEAVQYLLNHSWRGNVRELENLIQRAVILGSGDLIELHDLRVERRQISDNVIKTIREMEKDLIIKTLQMTGGNRKRAAESLGISVRTLRNKINEYRLEGGFVESVLAG
ncbi:MAG: sigma-54-dependent Fis family transcriptional regulator [Nitrospirae bacterium]|nr:MAG: sigma-54-dependent Fis family transcriptional regulator [Nitrospirota bacterium]